MIKMKEHLTSTGSTLRYAEDMSHLRKSLHRRWQKDPFAKNIAFCQEIVPTKQDICKELGTKESQRTSNGFIHASNMFQVKDPMPTNETEKAHPLLFTREELKILQLGVESDVTDDIRAGVIWHAIQREQVCQNRKVHKPPSAKAVLTLLLSPKVSQIDENESINFCDIYNDDAVIVHAVDVMLSHYEKDTRKINPFEGWAGAWDKGINIGKLNNGAKINSIESWWKSYYSAKILGANNTSTKMTKGQKITACLLHWAKHMQLNDRKRWASMGDKDSYNKESFLSSFPPQLPSNIEFVSEVMRLFAARWIEASTDATGAVVGLKRRGPKKRGAVKSPNLVGPKSSATRKRKTLKIVS
jgi:hypothetical protein